VKLEEKCVPNKRFSRNTAILNGEAGGHLACRSQAKQGPSEVCV